MSMSFAALCSDDGNYQRPSTDVEGFDPNQIMDLDGLNGEEPSFASKKSHENDGNQTSSARKKGSKKKEIHMLSQPNDSELADDEEIFECIKNKTSISVMMHTWLSEWKKDKSKFVVRIINFVLQSSGLGPVLDIGDYDQCPSGYENVDGDNDDEDPSHLYIVNWISNVVDTKKQDNKVENCPLLSKSKEFKSFESSFCEFWSKLPPDLLGQEFFILIIRWLYAMSISELRPLRYVSTYAIFEYSLSIAKLLASKSKQTKNLQRLGHNHTSKKSSKAALTKEIAALNEEIHSLESILSDIFEMVISCRYRDFVPLIRIKTIEVLCKLIEIYPSQFLDNQHLKYIGWLLFDKKSHVRLAAINCFMELTKNSEIVPSLGRFIEYYKQRLGDIVTEEVSSLSVVGFQVLSFMKSLNKKLVTEEMESQAFCRVCSAVASVREAAAEYILDTLKTLNAKNLNENASETRLRALLNIIEDKTPGSQMPHFIVDALTNVKGAQKDSPLYDWDAIYSLLTYKSKNKMLHDSQRILLAKILMLTAKKLMGESLLSKNQKSNMKLKLHRNRLLTFLYEMFPKLLTMYKAESHISESLAYLPRYLEVSKSISNKYNESIMGVLKDLSDVALISIDRSVISTAFSSLSCLKENKFVDSYVQLEFSNILNNLGTQFNNLYNDLVEGSHDDRSESKAFQFKMNLTRLNELNKVYSISSCLGPSFFENLVHILELYLESNEPTFLNEAISSEVVELIKFILINSLLEIYTKSTESKKNTRSKTCNNDSDMDAEEAMVVEEDGSNGIDDGEIRDFPQVDSSVLNESYERPDASDSIRKAFSSLIEKIKSVIELFGKIIRIRMDLTVVASRAFVSICQLIQLFSPSTTFFGIEDLSYDIPPEDVIDLLCEYYRASMDKIAKGEILDEEGELSLELTCCLSKLIENRLLGPDSFKHSSLVLVHYLDSGKCVEALIDQFYNRMRFNSHCEIEIGALKLMLKTLDDPEDEEGYYALGNLTIKFLSMFDVKVVTDRNYLVEYFFSLLFFGLEHVSTNRPFIDYVLLPVVKKMDIVIRKLILYIIENGNAVFSVQLSRIKGDPKQSEILENIKEHLLGNKGAVARTPKKVRTPAKTPSRSRSMDTNDVNNYTDSELETSTRSPNMARTPKRVTPSSSKRSRTRNTKEHGPSSSRMAMMDAKYSISNSPTQKRLNRGISTVAEDEDEPIQVNLPRKINLQDGDYDTTDAEIPKLATGKDNPTVVESSETSQQKDNFQKTIESFSGTLRQGEGVDILASEKGGEEGRYSEDEIDYSERDPIQTSSEQNSEVDSNWDEPRITRSKRSRLSSANYLSSPSKKKRY